MNNVKKQNFETFGGNTENIFWPQRKGVLNNKKNL